MISLKPASLNKRVSKLVLQKEVTEENSERMDTPESLKVDEAVTEEFNSAADYSDNRHL